MAIYKCKMCGGDLEVGEGTAVVECEYCGTKQTVPTSNDEEIRNLFNRATALRRRCEFDKAEQIYERILTKDQKQSEAYWGVLLCRYGIEYVEDPETNQRIPTCHRTSFEAITSDEYYKSALEHADPVQKKIYEEEAKYIDGVQKEILALSQKEEPYDVFICYKETDENGRRTQDSAIANDIYYQLTQEGYKVFYAAITLEDKLGSAYEPIIFAALNSAKVMLAIGTRPEYFNAVWVKNEWSRFLKMMKEDKTKQLIPCYRGMDAYELPEEFAHLQAQDMGKIGFINDLVRGIKKIIPKEEQKTESRTSDMGGSASLKSLLQRVDLFLEDHDWPHAKEYAEKVLDIDPQNAEAYIGELLALLNFAKFDELFRYTEPVENHPLFRKAYRFADSVLKAKMDEMVVKNAAFRENRRQDDIYANASEKENSGKNEADFLAAAQLFESIPSCKDSAACAKRCREKAEKVREEAMFAQYQDACAKLGSNDRQEVMSAYEMLRSLSGYRDSDEKFVACIERLTELDRLAEEHKEALELEARKRKKKKRITAAVACGVIVAIVTAIAVPCAVADYNKKVARSLQFTLSPDGTHYIVDSDFEIYLEDRLTTYIIPNIYNGKPVTEISEYAFFCFDGVTSIVIPNSIQVIGDGAFGGCECLQSIKIPEGVVKIGAFTFKECKSLQSIVIPDSVTEIDQGAFQECVNLKSVTIGANVSVIWSAFEGCSNLSNVYFADPNGWWSIGSDAITGLSDSATAAKYLTETYSSAIWRKN